MDEHMVHHQTEFEPVFPTSQVKGSDGNANPNFNITKKISGRFQCSVLKRVQTIHEYAPGHKPVKHLINVSKCYWQR